MAEDREIRPNDRVLVCGTDTDLYLSNYTISPVLREKRYYFTTDPYAAMDFNCRLNAELDPYLIAKEAGRTANLLLHVEVR